MAVKAKAYQESTSCETTRGDVVYGDASTAYQMLFSIADSDQVSFRLRRSVSWPATVILSPLQKNPKLVKEFYDEKKSKQMYWLAPNGCIYMCSNKYK